MKSWIVAVAMAATLTFVLGCDGDADTATTSCPAGYLETVIGGQTGCAVPATEQGGVLQCPAGTTLTEYNGSSVCLEAATAGIPAVGEGTESTSTLNTAGTTGGETGENATGGETAGGETAGGETASEDNGETAEEGGSGDESGEGDESITGPSKEDCINGTDDDGDGMIDCEDPECAGKPACVEADCGDGVDNDGNGLVDCDDDACIYSDACSVESCNTWYLCLGEQGCECELGVNCPDVDSDEFGACMQTCAQNETCNGVCVSSLSIPVQEALAAFQNCTQTFCAQATSDDAYSECMIENCALEYVECFFPEDKKEICKEYFACTETNNCFAPENDNAATTDCVFGQCLDSYANCNYDGDDGCDAFLTCLQGQNCNYETMSEEEYSECTSPCYDAVSPQGYIDVIGWDGCRFDLCNLDGDDTADSTICMLLASYLGCFEKSGSCIDKSLFVGEGTCSDVANCLAECEDFTTPLEVEGAQPGQDITCDLVCLEQVNPATSVELSDLFTCVIQTCGSTEDALTPGCIAEAIAAEGGCAAEYTACQ